MLAVPTGTVTFLFTDIEGSTRLAQKYPKTWESLRKRYDEILQCAMDTHDGYVFQIIGDAFCVAFHTALDALHAAVLAQRILNQEVWGPDPIKVRMGINTGTAQAEVENDRLGGYKGYISMARVQRLMSAAHGGQVLISLATEELVRDELPEGVSLRDMGERRLKDLFRPEHIYQLIITTVPADFPPIKTLDVFPNNLPMQTSSFIGREKEVAEIIRLINSHRLVTLTGIGGTGKTRLSFQVAADLIDDFPGGVWLVQLAPLSNPALVPQAAAQALGVHEEPGRSLSEVLIEYLRSKHLLLIMDNCEHLAEACACFTAELLQKVPNLKILATSRVTLNVPGEMIYPVHPLALPDPNRLFSLPALTQYEAVRLFIERAISVHPDFSVTNTNAPAVAQICQHLDGIPLAIELAATRIRSLSPDQIAKRLGDRFNLLTGGSRTVLPRQQTLRATIDWSYELLSENERTLLNQLFVFSGGFSLDAVESVYVGRKGNRANTLDLLTALIENSLVIREDENVEARFRLLETVQQYASEKLQESGEFYVTRDRHLAFYLDLAEKGAPGIRIGQPEWIDRFEVEYNNLRAALEYAITRDAELAVRLGTALDWFWDISDRFEEAHRFSTQVLALTESWPPCKMRAMALLLAGTHTHVVDHQVGQTLLEASLEMARTLNEGRQELEALESLTQMSRNRQNWAQMRSYAEQHLACAQKMDEKNDITMSLWALATVALQSGDKELGRTLYEQSLELARKENLTFSIASVLWHLARLERSEGNYGKAKVMYLECVQIMRQMGYRSYLASILFDLGQIALQENNPEQAQALFGESLTIWQEIKKDWLLVNPLLGFAGVAGEKGMNELAAQLFGAAETILKKLETEMDDLDRMTYDPVIAAIRDKLGENHFTAAWASGGQLSLKEAIKHALQELQ